ncbi:CmcJ/NvfI family oxidoreductase [Labrys wisconsinensis]|uniref:Methyltransferase n=1 Tax=Labrys wisconsinensis TaxID=425677 RepID=A0ABU0JF39_9HYPH|nr:CmcJ/NvfI family oxidoreductase [Labrys wisconsinensis]MDQ0472902.1 hypothetical protein [Labrys wisconsinensis]
MVQGSDTASLGRGAARVRPDFEARMNYLGEQADKPLFHTSDPSQSRIVIESHPVVMRDARALAAPSLDREGFVLIRQPLPPFDYRDTAQRDGPYLVLLQDVIREALGAAKVITDTSILRLPGPDAFQVPVTRVHCDYTAGSARRLLSESWDQTLGREAGLADTAGLMAESVDAAPGERRYGRVLAVNCWRTISEPPHDYPLAVCARPSLAPQDVRVADFIEEVEGGEPYRAELSLCRYNPRHAWYSYADMRPDEVLLFLGFDFSDPGQCGAMHSAFPDPACPPDAPGRASVEVRTFVLFDA